MVFPCCLNIIIDILTTLLLSLAINLKLIYSFEFSSNCFEGDSAITLQWFHTTSQLQNFISMNHWRKDDEARVIESLWEPSSHGEILSRDN
jgi:hypothetical protein